MSFFPSRLFEIFAESFLPTPPPTPHTQRMFWNHAPQTHFVKRTSWKLEVGPEGDGGGDVVIDDSCDWGCAGKTTGPKVTAALNLHRRASRYPLLLAAFTTSLVAENLRSEKRWLFPEQTGNKNQATRIRQAASSHLSHPIKFLGLQGVEEGPVIPSMKELLRRGVDLGLSEG